MKTLPEEIAETLPAMLEAAPLGVSLADVAVRLAASVPDVRRAVGTFKARPELGVVVVRYGRAPKQFLRLAGVGFGQLERVCEVCGAVFEVKAKTIKKRCCSRSCAPKLIWMNPEARARVMAGIKAQKQTPEGRAHTAEANRKCWADPEQRRRLSDWNKERWADPETKAHLSAAIAASHGRPEVRDKVRKRIRRRWDDPAEREKLERGIRRSKTTQEARAKFSRLLKDRWKDPEFREKWTQGFCRAQSARRAALSARMKEVWADPDGRKKMEAATAKMKETKSRKRAEKPF